MKRPRLWSVLWALVCCGPALAQTQYNPDWYTAGQPHVKLSVAQDGIYRVEASALVEAGVSIATIDPLSLRLIENGREIPIWYEGPGNQMGSSDYFLFVGRRNTGADEDWVYNYNPDFQSSTDRSLYTDTTTYFLTWGGQEGLRYRLEDNGAVAGDVVDRVRVEDRLEDDNTYFFGAPESSGNPLYTAGEGYYMRAFSHGNEILTSSYVLPFSDLTRFDDDSVRVEAKLQGGTRSPHLGFLVLRFIDEASNTQVDVALDSVAWSNYDSAELSASLAQSLVPGSGANLRIRVGSDNSIGARPSSMYLDYVAYSYRRALDPTSGQFHFQPEVQGPATFQLTAPSDQNVIVLKPTSASRFDVSGNGVFGDMRQSGDAYWLTLSDDFLQPIISLDRPSDLAKASNGADYVIISAPDLMESAQTMSEYRASIEGGQYETLVVDVTDVFDQFDYGRATPVAVKRFIDRMLSWSKAPRFVTIWGDALYPDAARARNGWEVPSFGNSSSDSWFAMQTRGNLEDFWEAVAVGRLPIRTNDAGSAFVDKIARYESRPAADWQKRIIMMSGGADLSEQRALTFYTRRWGDIAADSPFGGDITYFHKTSEAALDPTFLDSVDVAIAEGSSWLGFFGHSAADTWEIVTENPTLFNNSQTLPVAVSLGCFTGAIARGDGTSFDQPPFAELLVTESQNGAIAHYGGSTSSLISAASRIADPLYDQVFRAGLRVLGEAMTLSKAVFLGVNPTPDKIETALQYSLVGDPATRLALPSSPDFHLDASSIDVTPAGPVSGIDSSFVVKVTVTNRGLVPGDSVNLQLVRQMPDGSETSHSARLASFPLKTEVAFALPVNESDVGQNRLQVRIDSDGAYAETSEDDNEIEVTLIVFASGVVQLFPPDFGLLASDQPTLLVGKASTMEDQVAIVTEIDTVSTFDSQGKVVETLAAGALTTWTPAVQLLTGTTYSWRVAVESDDTPKWRTRSFTIRPDLPFDGWFQKDRQFELDEHGPYLTYVSPSWRMQHYNVDVRIRSAHFGATAASTITVGGFEHETLEVGFAVVIAGADGIYKTSDSFVAYPNIYNRDQVEERERMRALIASAEESDYVFINSRFLRIDPNSDYQVPEETKAIFREIGSTQIDSVDLNDLWNYAVRIGDETPIVDEWQNRIPDVGPHILWSDFSIPVRFASGDSKTGLIGPAVSWHEVRFTGTVTDPRSSVTAYVLATNGDTLGSETLFEPGGTARIDLGPAGLNIDAREHTFLRLGVALTDSSRRDTPQLVDWYVGYDPVSELVLDAGELVASTDTVGEGEVLDVAANVINGGPSPIDSVFVTYTVTDASNHSEVAAVDTLLDVEAGSTVQSTASISTQGITGRNRLTVAVSQKRGPEPATFNNTAIGEFTVLGDKTPPVFSLVVDGASYPNDPRVINTTDDPTLPFFPVRPKIEITVSDESEYQQLADTTVINLMLDGKRISYTRSDVEFVPGTLEKNEARLIFTPDFSGQDTTHTLKAWGQDASGNTEPAKETPYTLSFRVQSSAEIESLYPYPNPMHNFTTFMFRLRGADPSLVEDLRIRIYSISGRPVREFDLLRDPGLLEEGGLRIGWNRLVWDGRDEDGDLLATGVYLYKVFLRSEGEEMFVNNKSGIEKIAIIR